MQNKGQAYQMQGYPPQGAPYTVPPPGYQPVAAQPTAQPGQPVQYVETTYRSPPQAQEQNPGFKARSELGCGITTTVFGCLILLGGFYTLAQGRGGGYYQEVWGGILFLVTGIMGILAGKTRKNGYMIASIVLGVISSIISFACVIIAALALVAIMGFHSSLSGESSHHTKSVFTLAGIIILLGAIFYVSVFIVVVLQAAFCCKCCFRDEPAAQQQQQRAPGVGNSVV